MVRPARWPRPTQAHSLGLGPHATAADAPGTGDRTANHLVEGVSGGTRAPARRRCVGRGWLGDGRSRSCGCALELMLYICGYYRDLSRERMAMGMLSLRSKFRNVHAAPWYRPSATEHRVRQHRRGASRALRDKSSQRDRIYPAWAYTS